MPTWRNRLLRRAATALVGAFLLAAAPALAQDDVGDSRAQSFRTVEGAVEEDVPGAPLLLGAYAIFWLFTLVYVMRLALQQKRTLSGLERLEALMEKNPPAGE